MEFLVETMFNLLFTTIEILLYTLSLNWIVSPLFELSKIYCNSSLVVSEGIICTELSDRISFSYLFELSNLSESSLFKLLSEFIT